MMASSYNPSILLLDLGLPDMDGTEVIRQVRSWSQAPILVISARSDDTDKIGALDAGADDYITKPFSVEELLARLRVTLRRLNYLENLAGKESSIYVNAGLKIDYAAHTVFLNEDELHLTQTEYRLLCLLAKNTGKVLTYKYITQNIWGSSWENNMATLRVVVTTLRRKLSSQESEPMIQTHVGIGYRMVKL
jgi:two-component system KDP operon response regulator KdpE